MVVKSKKRVLEDDEPVETHKKKKSDLSLKRLQPEDSSGEEENEDVDVDMDEDPDVEKEQPAKLSKSQRKSQKKKLAKAEKKAARALLPKKEEKIPPLTSTVRLAEETNPKVPLQDRAALLKEIKNRKTLQNDLSLMIKPVPKKLAPGMIADICPAALTFYSPSFVGAGYGFVTFRTSADLEEGKKQLEGKTLKNKPLVVTSCSTKNADLSSKKLHDFDLTKLTVLNLKRATNRYDLGQIFKTAVDIKFRMLTDGSCAGSCDLLFKSEANAIEAFYRGHKAEIRGIPIYVNFTPVGRHEHETGVKTVTSQKIVTSKKAKSKGIDDPVASDQSEPECEEKGYLDAEFSIKGKERIYSKKSSPGKRLHAYQQRPKNTGPRTKMKKHKAKKS
ncbi:hypothetical protein Ciccas_008800 [Cichlidogyrus casuarinus]|uniref:RRM domain-containing protein n=1 Tax=Cichlidogyrus casuarinus TaxID=1844966 RepID=A0ABD2PYV3_9PLAT